MTGSGKEDAWSEGQYWFREVEQIVRRAREEAEREGISVPADFARSKQWREAERAIEEVMGSGDYIKTRDLCRDYVCRAVRYCQTWIEKQRTQITQRKAA